MKKEYYFVVSVPCIRLNMKDKMLAEYLKSYKNCLLEFGEEYTPEVLIADINKRLDKINASNKRCRDIRLMRENGMNGEIVFEFESGVGLGIQSAMMVLRPVRRWVSGSSSNGKSDAEKKLQS
jgi:hypothetical protein